MRKVILQKSIIAGGISGAVLVLYKLLILAIDTHNMEVISTVMSLITGMGIMLGIIEFKKTNKGLMTFWQGLSIGVLVCAFAGFVLGVYELINARYFHPIDVQAIMEQSRKLMEEMEYPVPQIEQSMEMTRKILVPEMMVFFTIIVSVINGFFSALILAAIMQRRYIPNDNESYE